MKNWLMVSLIIILVGGAGFGGYFYAKQNATTEKIDSRISTLSAEISNLGDNIKNVQSDVSGIGPVLQRHMNATINVINTIQPAVLRITVSAKGVAVSGSGFIISNDGYAVTNHHVIETAGSITVITGDGNQYNATVTNSDSKRDLALLKLDSKRTDFPVAALGLSSDLIIGDDVVACGYPLGLNLPGPASFTRGIISAVRTLDGQAFVQTDCEVDPGSSGGCLINVRGAVVGVMSDAVLPAGQQLEAIALAIPVTDVQTFIQNNLK